MKSKTLIGAQSSRTITPGGFAFTKRKYNGGRFWEHHKEIKDAAERVLLAPLKAPRVK